MKKIFNVINGFFTTLSFIIKDMNATVTPVVPNQRAGTSTKPAATAPAFTGQNEGVIKDTTGN